MLDPTGIYYMYLRKSREDREAESHGEGETLARHENRLKELAEQLKITISKVYREVVSGETIAARPEMMRMLSDIEREQPEGVLVVELERLARGDTRDQGLIMETFKYGNTKIITPIKTYDPNDEFDEEYAEFGLFMSRREYKIINRRLQNGRRASSKEGKWIGNVAPYGYERIKLPREKGYTLKPLPDEATIVQFIFQLFTEGTPESDNLPMGAAQIAHLLDDMNVLPRKSDHWETGVIKGILKNYAYIGKLEVGKRKQIKTIENGVVKLSRPVNANPEIFDAIHPPIIKENLFYAAKRKMEASFRPTNCSTIKSPLAGLIYCSECQRILYRRPAGKKNATDTFLCKTHGCPTVGSFYYLVEERLIQFLKDTLKQYKIKIQGENFNNWNEVLERKMTMRSNLTNEENKLQHQLDTVYDYFEQKLYSLELFRKRSGDLTKKIEENKKSLEQIDREISDIQQRIVRKEQCIPHFENILKSYTQTEDPLQKNALLKQVVDHVFYAKTKKGTRLGYGVDCFTLDVYLKLPFQDI
ncbi:recombinase family protein [Lacrimispora sp. JR3]|uniref:recombinase family protein n=1 Tax=Lacrimispora sinapis TaxID=3111456 RepID=UPI0037491A69